MSAHRLYRLHQAERPYNQYRKYITPYRALLLIMLLPMLFSISLRLPWKNELLGAFILLSILTFVVEVLLFAFQFTRKECAYLEVLLFILLIPFMVML